MQYYDRWHGACFNQFNTVLKYVFVMIFSMIYAVLIRVTVYNMLLCVCVCSKKKPDAKAGHLELLCIITL